MAQKGGRNSALGELDGEGLRAALHGSMRNFHNQIYDLRAAFAALPIDDPDRNAGMAIAELVDINYHQLQQQIDLFAVAVTSYIVKHPLLLIENEDGHVSGLEIWMPKNQD
jgi:hypothetical protein